MEAINFVTELISNFGFPVACVIALAVYSKNTTDKIISLTQEVTTALISSTKSIDDFKDAITNLLEKRWYNGIKSRSRGSGKKWSGL